MTPYSALLRVSDEDRTVEIVEHRLLDLLRDAVSMVVVDEEWYLRKYPDVRDAIKRGSVACAKDHYVMDGYFEDRLPREFVVDKEWYLAENHDVADAMRNGQVHSLQRHFEDHGYKEGRRPYDDWSL